MVQLELSINLYLGRAQGLVILKVKFLTDLS